MSAHSKQSEAISPDGIWSFPNPELQSVSEGVAGEINSGIRTTRLNPTELQRVLDQAPLELPPESRNHSVILSLPLPDGSFSRFRIAASPIMEPELAAKFPEIKTYQGQGIDDPTATTRFDWAPQGLHAIMLSERGTFLIQPVTQGETQTYLTYDSHHAPERNQPSSCSVSKVAEVANGTSGADWNHRLQTLPNQFSSGTQVRTYRMAVAATGEFTRQFGGGTVAGGVNAITSSINLISAIFQREAAIRFVLIARENELVFTDPVTDGYTNGNNNSLLTENQTKLDMLIGAANYDIGHIYATTGNGFSGVAQLSSVCVNGTKAMGASSTAEDPSSNIVVSGVAHEFAHQFSVTHSYNGTTGGCNEREMASAWEPGSGTTIMSYSGVCNAENVVLNADLYFHTGSLGLMLAYAGRTEDCSVKTPSGNNPPVIGTLSNATVPARTPFTLTAPATDQDGDALTYCWEEFDLGDPGPPNTDNGNRPLFRSYPPTTNQARSFPSLPYILENNGVPPATIGTGDQTLLSGESQITTTRTMNFRVTVRDNRAAGGGTSAAAMQVNVLGDRGPFQVTAPASGTAWTPGSQQTVTWSVAGTNTAPIGVANVRISLSSDGGMTFPTVLAESVPNNGSATVTAPANPVANARIRVEAIGNVFFNISPAFSVRPACSPITIGPDALPVAPVFMDYTARITATGGIPPLTFRVSQGNLPENVNLAADGQISGVPQVAGMVSFTVTATDSIGCTQTRQYTINVQPEANAGDTGGMPPRNGRQAGDLFFEFPVTLTAPSNLPIEIEYQTEDGTAVAGMNYEATSGKLVFPPGSTSQTIKVKVLEATPDGEAEDDFFVVLGNPVNAMIEDGRAEGSIIEDDASTCPAITVNPATLPNGKQDTAYNQAFSASGGGQIAKYVLSGGSLPAGLTLNQTSGILSGTPETTGSFSFELTASDNNRCLGARRFTLTIAPATPGVSSFSPTSGRAGTSVTIFGRRLTGATQVQFGGRPATNFTVNSAGQITAVVPAGTTTGQITVTTPGGTNTSATSFMILNSVPTVTDGTLSTKQNAPATGKLVGSDAEGNPLRFETVGRESGFKGMVVITNSATGDFTYTPGPNFVGTEFFYFRVFDGRAYSDLGRVTVTVTADSSPRITGAEVSGKDLIVTGDNFANGAVILVDGAPKDTSNDAQSPSRRLIAKKVGKKIKTGQTVKLTVRNPDGTTSAEFSFTR
ncbi:MAG: putative Ig domain-containing protein [Blastocatellia bacterium]|nr:putative Ig domain-containing protein [Blastocatellia bacterium]